MSILLSLVLVTVVWTIASVWWAVYNLGDKYRKTKWWEWVLGTPALLIAYAVGWCTHALRRQK